MPEADLAIRHRLDRLHLEFPFAGSRMLRGLLAAEGCTLGRRHVKTLPAPDIRVGGYCASYVNFAHVNCAVIVPKFGKEFSETDNLARDKIYEPLGGTVKVEMLDVQVLASAGGGIHCATYHRPLIKNRS